MLVCDKTFGDEQTTGACFRLETPNPSQPRKTDSAAFPLPPSNPQCQGASGTKIGEAKRDNMNAVHPCAEGFEWVRLMLF